MAETTMKEGNCILINVKTGQVSKIDDFIIADCGDVDPGLAILKIALGHLKAELKLTRTKAPVYLALASLTFGKEQNEPKES